MEVEAEPIGKLEEISNGGVKWVNLERPTPKEVEVLGQRYHFHQLDLEDCLSKRQLTKVSTYGDYLFAVLHFPICGDNSCAVLSSQVSVFLGRNLIVTIHQGDLKPLVNTFQTCMRDEQQRQTFMDKGATYLLHQIIDVLVDDLFPTLDKVMGGLEGIEDKVFDEKVEAIGEITRLRRQIADLRRIVFPHRRVISQLAAKAQQFAPSDVSAYFGDVIDHIEKVWETLEECKETVDIFKDTDFMLSTEKTNKILALLTIIFTLSIPATVVSTFYGMNINLPGGIQTGTWTFLGPYTTLLLIALVSTIPAVLMTWLFRRHGWL